jgi:lysophospholipase L1-like esterase
MNQLLLCFALFLGLIACGKKETSSASIPPPTITAPPKTWLALGDSYTIGQGVTETERFPLQTAVWLRNNGINMSNPVYIATTGWTTTFLQAAIANNNPPPYDVVSLLIGVNDQFQARDTTGYRQRFTQLLQTSIQLAKNKPGNVVVLSIPDYSVTPFVAPADSAAIRQEIDWFNAINKEVTLSFRVPYLDITPSTREARTNPSLLAADRLHLSGIEYKKWAERLGPLLLPVLR